MRWLIPIFVLAFAGGTFAQDGWRLETPSAQWDPRRYHNAVTFNNEIWVLQGGAGINGPRKDAWSSSDGVNWNEKVALLPWINSAQATTIVFNGELWVLGGDQGGNFTSQVWHSPDGVNWTQEPDAPWMARKAFAGVVFNGKMWIFGGWGKQYQPPYLSQLLNDVWSTSDGVNWTQEVAAANWSARNGHRAVAFNNRMWILGGGDFQVGLRNDVWSSTDGVNWVQETASAPWESRHSFAAVDYRDRLWVVGGEYFVSQVQQWSGKDDAWSSADGVTWVKEMDGAPWGDGGRIGQAVTVFNNRIWLMGGIATTTGHMNDVWSYGLHIAPDVLPDAEEVQPYNAYFEARVGDGQFNWTLSGGSLPPGLTFDTSSTAATTSITGTPVTAGDYTFTIQLEDTDGNVIEQDYTLTVHPRPPLNSNNSSGNSGCTARSTSSGLAGLTKGISGGLPWTLLLGALTLAAVAVLRRRAVASASRR